MFLDEFSVYLKLFINFWGTDKDMVGCNDGRGDGVVLGETGLPGYHSPSTIWIKIVSVMYSLMNYFI